eukprot:Nitzschia sp. Nitz4//scaffold175_size95217//6965//8575//NITZ4_004716-RA/size95217-processed-gene-0.40-mRNA-1//-1//CDS//3329538918//8200//frame0
MTTSVCVQICALLLAFLLVPFCGVASDELHVDEDTIAATIKDLLSNALLESREMLSREGISSESLLQEVWNKVMEEDEDLEFPGTLHQMFLADRQIDQVNNIIHDPDCMELELDANDDYDVNWVADALAKCRVLVIRNVLDPDMILNQFKPEYAKYLRALQSGEVHPDRRVLYEPGIPTKRYEIFLPEHLAMADIVANPQVLEILRHPKILGPGLLLHSLGTVVTEPGAPHQGWHEEDNYIFGTEDSMENFGIAGHDLPPYLINMFSPLLNLTHDHGLTEFCVGTSVTTGLLSGNFHVHDTSLLHDHGDAFLKTYQFHQAHIVRDGGVDLPCPTENYRSVLLNVGDIVLFDYQIMHRAGFNVSPDTRAQIYLAYAREWYRDFNYHINEIPYQLDAPHTDFGSITRWTRFAMNVDDEIFTDGEDVCDTNESETCCSAAGPIEEIRGLLYQHPIPSKFLTHQRHFVVSNLDIDEGLATISLDDGDPEPFVHPGEHLQMSAVPGSKIILRKADGGVLKTWEVPFDISQLVLSKAVVGLS